MAERYLEGVVAAEELLGEKRTAWRGGINFRIQHNDLPSDVIQVAAKVASVALYDERFDLDDPDRLYFSEGLDAETRDAAAYASDVFCGDWRSAGHRCPSVVLAMVSCRSNAYCMVVGVVIEFDQVHQSPIESQVSC